MKHWSIKGDKSRDKSEPSKSDAEAFLTSSSVIWLNLVASMTTVPWNNLETIS